MRFDNPVYLSVDGSHNIDIPVNKTLIFRGASRGISKVSISENGVVLDTVYVSMLPFHRWKASLYIPFSSDYARTFTISGLSDQDSVLKQIDRVIRQIPLERIKLKRSHHFWDWHYGFQWAWDFTFGRFTSIYTLAGKEEDGWQVSEADDVKTLIIPKSCKY